MGLFGFIGKVASATVKTAVIPLAIVKDVVMDDDMDNTSKLIESIGDNIEDGFDKLTGEL